MPELLDWEMRSFWGIMIPARFLCVSYCPRGSDGLHCVCPFYLSVTTITCPNSSGTVDNS